MGKGRPGMLDFTKGFYGWELGSVISFLDEMEIEKEWWLYFSSYYETIQGTLTKLTLSPGRVFGVLRPTRVSFFV